MKSSPPVVAVVENNAAMLKALERLLRAFGYASELFESGEAYLAWTGPQPHCLILDISLGGINGVELLQQLAQAGNAPPAIFVTSQADKLYREQAEALGCVAYIQKPFASQSLLQALRLALAPAGAQQQ
jgi:FixJ family two-component response regulator